MYEKLFDAAVWLGKYAFTRIVSDPVKRRDILKKANELLEEAKKYIQEIERGQ